jgi:glucose-fructose oxidoreductase
MPQRPWRIAGINFDHMHMGDLLRMVAEHPHAEIVGIADETPARMERVRQSLNIPQERAYGDYRACLEATQPDLVILCPATAKHAEWTEKVAPYGVHILMEKPFAASLAEADRMIAALEQSGKQLAINWPLRWYPPHITTKRLIDEGVIGEVIEVHYYDGNRGPLYHLEGKLKREPTLADKQTSWFYKRAEGGGALLDYLGYGVTLGSWFNGAQQPLEVTAVSYGAEGLEVDEHSITIVRYAVGLSKFETRWGTFTDPWTHQPQPKCGFVVRGDAGTISSYDYEDTIRVQTRDHPEGQVIPVDVVTPPYQNPIQYLLHCLETGAPIDGPLSPKLCRLGQQMVDAAIESARRGCTVKVA